MPPIPPVLRILAFMIDKTLIWASFGLVIALLGQSPVLTETATETSWKLRLDTTWVSSQFRPLITRTHETCLPGGPEDLAGLQRFYPEAEVTSALYCPQELYGVFVGSDVRLVLQPPTGPTIADTGQMIPDSLPWSQIDLLVALGFVLASWACLLVFGTTPGKALFGLRVTGSPLAKLGRETIRLSPVLLTLILPGDLALGFLSIGWTGGALAIGGFLLGMAAKLALWVYPVAKDHPLMPWDRWTGCRLVKAGEGPAGENPF